MLDCLHVLFEKLHKFYEGVTTAKPKWLKSRQIVKVVSSQIVYQFSSDLPKNVPNHHPQHYLPNKTMLTAQDSNLAPFSEGLKVR